MWRWLRYQYRKVVRPRRITNGGVTIDLGPIARTRYARAIYRDVHEGAEREIVGRHLRADDVVLELGAGLGVVTILCAQRVGSERVHTFEANPQLEPLLRRNFALNGVSPRLTMQMVCLDAGPQEFHVSERFVVSSRHAAATGGAGETATATSVPSASLPEVLHRLRPTFLVADIEGGELDLADERVDLSSVQRICVEVHPHITGDEGVSRLIEALLGKGFSLRLGQSRGCVLLFERMARVSAAAA
jgi:FkbM family methyltransferase